MNLQGVALNEDLRESIHSVHIRDWNAFFDSLKAQEFVGFGSASPDSLLLIQCRVNVIDEFKTLFQQIHQSRKT